MAWVRPATVRPRAHKRAAVMLAAGAVLRDHRSCVNESNDAWMAWSLLHHLDRRGQRMRRVGTRGSSTRAGNSYNLIVLPTDGFARAGIVSHRGLNLIPTALPAGRARHSFGAGPFARLIMPPLPNAPGVYLWEKDGKVVYVGQTRMPFAKRLGPKGCSTISAYKTFAWQPGRRNGGQQTNCRVNALANASLSAGSVITIWYRVTPSDMAAIEEARWMAAFGTPKWNRRTERE